MRYQGGKTRIAKYIAEIINKDLNGKDYYEPFVGANNIVKHLEGYREAFLSDANLWVINYHIQRQEGWTPFDELNTKNEKEIKQAHKLCREVVRGKVESCKYSLGFIGYILQQCSFGGDFNGGFINREGKVYYKGDHDYFKLRKVSYKKNQHFEAKDYLKVTPKNAIVYLDPPYEGTSKYSFKINHKEFWDYARKLSRDNIVYVSEQNAPDDFEIVWSKPFTRTLNHFNTNKSKDERIKTECLFRLKKP